MQEKIHFSYKFLIRLTHFSDKIICVSAHFSDFKSKSSLRCPCFSFGRCAHRPRCNRHIAVTILVSASKPRFKGSYSDVRCSPHRMHSVSVRRGPHKKRLPNNQCSIGAIIVYHTIKLLFDFNSVP